MFRTHAEELEAAWIALLLTGFILVGVTAPANALDPGELRGYFEAELTPYGRWVERPSYGRVWVPREQRGWRPYSRGHWIYTDEYGWVWQPEEEWGPVVYHYGRWGYERGSWFWVPDEVWGPAWVDWYTTDDYIGWAPLSPSQSWDWRDEWRPGHSRYYDDPAAYVFVPANEFTVRDVSRVALPSRRVQPVLRQARNITTYRTVNDRVVNPGPRPEVIRRATGRPVRSVAYEPRSIRGKPLPRPPVRDRQRALDRRGAERARPGWNEMRDARPEQQRKQRVDRPQRRGEADRELRKEPEKQRRQPEQREALSGRERQRDAHPKRQNQVERGRMQAVERPKAQAQRQGKQERRVERPREGLTKQGRSQGVKQQERQQRETAARVHRQNDAPRAQQRKQGQKVDRQEPAPGQPRRREEERGRRGR